jgi:hypothetical protein
VRPQPRAGGADRAAAAWAALVAILLLVPVQVPRGFGAGGAVALDELGHFLLFLVLALLLSRAARPRTRHFLLYAAASSFLYGALLEAMQSGMGVRHAELGDLVADGIGSVAGALVPILRPRP